MGGSKLDWEILRWLILIGILAVLGIVGFVIYIIIKLVF